MGEAEDEFFRRTNFKRRDYQRGECTEGGQLLNHQMDIDLFNEIGREFKKRFEGKEINKILTIEASGIGIACIAAQHFHVPVVFAKISEHQSGRGDACGRGRIVHT